MNTILKWAKLITVLGCIILLFACSSHKKHGSLSQTVNQQNKTTYYFEPDTTALVGTIKLCHAFGPPGYGETPESDEKVTYYAIHLSKPINILPSKNVSEDTTDLDTVPNLADIQLVVLDKVYFPLLKAAVGKKAFVKGTLFAAETAHHYTPALLTLSQFEEL